MHLGREWHVEATPCLDEAVRGGAELLRAPGQQDQRMRAEDLQMRWVKTGCALVCVCKRAMCVFVS
eukprot:2315890-Alexandrium_andersonii.AAC.1